MLELHGQHETADDHHRQAEHKENVSVFFQANAESRRAHGDVGKKTAEQKNQSGEGEDAIDDGADVTRRFRQSDDADDGDADAGHRRRGRQDMVGDTVTVLS